MSDVAEKTGEAKAPKAKELKKYKVTIHSEGEGGDKGDVLIGHNFKLIQIKRDCEVVIDENFLGVLKSTVIDTMVKDGEGKMKPAKVPRYNFTAEPV
jgi:hypothetical protein